MRSLQRLVTLAVALMLWTGAAQADDAVREEQLLLPIQVGPHTEKIEALVVRPVRGEKFPIALIVNGSAAASPSSEHADWLAHIAHDFAHRGWLAVSVVWPGYGRSTGRFMDEAGGCSHPAVARFLDAHGSELGATLATLRQRPDVDPSLALGVGISIGGASMLDLGAQPGRPLGAIINISGGVYHYTHPGVADADCSAYQTDLVRNISAFGKGNPTPTLWIYARNDPFFSPALVERMVAGYRAQGGDARLVSLPPFGKDGHTLYKQEANLLLEPHIDDFLRRHRLPAMNEDALLPLLSQLSAADRKNAEAYRRSVTEKAMAISEQPDGIYWHYGARSLDSARAQALETCRKATGTPCRIVAENMQLVAGWQKALAHRTLGGPSLQTVADSRHAK